MARIDAFLKLGTQQGCSDIHLAVGVPPMLRMNGDLVPIKFRELRDTELEGYVLEARTGNPLAGERISIEYGMVEGPDVIDDPLASNSKVSLPKGAVRLDPLPPQVITDRDGHYLIEGIPVRNDLEARIFAPLEVESTIPLKQIEHGTNTRIFRLDRSESIEGVVLENS